MDDDDARVQIPLAAIVSDGWERADRPGYAARQRGGSVLCAARAQARVTIDVPVLTGADEPGVIDVGKLIQVVEPV
jgi:hypothetical protein